MYDSTILSNMALSHLSVSKEIDDLNEDSEEARACLRFYKPAIHTTLRRHHFGQTNDYVQLSKIADNPNDEWAFSYSYPAFTLKVDKILSGFRKDTMQSLVRYKVARGSPGRIILTDQEFACARCVMFEDGDEAYFQDDLAIAFSFFLAHLIAPRIARADPFGLGPRAKREWQMMISEAQANDANEEKEDEEPDSEFIRFRNSDGGIISQESFFAYPSGFTIS